MNMITRINKWWAGLVNRDPRSRLLREYNKKKEQAFRMSRTNRTESDRLEKEAQDILIKIDNYDDK